MKALSLGLLYVVLIAAITPLAADTSHPAEDAGITSVNSDVETKITFINQAPETIKIYWLSFEGKRVLYHTLKPGEAAEQVTFLTHPWLVTDDNDNAWQLYYPDAQPRKIEIKVEPPGEQ
jgi:hypothetical protein